MNSLNAWTPLPYHIEERIQHLQNHVYEHLRPALRGLIHGEFSKQDLDVHFLSNNYFQSLDILDDTAKSIHNEIIYNLFSGLENASKANVTIAQIFHDHKDSIAMWAGSIALPYVQQIADELQMHQEM